jgi:hypothetical protein
MAVVVAGLVACGDDDSSNSLLDSSNPSPPEEEENDADDAGSQLGDAVDTTDAAALTLTGSWEGTYECAQGPTGLTLTIDDRGDDQMAANFAYHPLDENPDVATGRYSMVGTVTDGELSLEGDQWIEQGGDYGMVGVESDIADRTDPEHLEGTVVGDGCTTFAVDRVSTEPWYTGTWSGKYGCNQGITGLTLTTEDAGDDTVRATYEFYEVPENPGVPSGSFIMEGPYVDGELELAGVEWVDRPENYEMVDLRLWSELGIDPQRIYGTVHLTGGGGSDCSLFTLDRVES